MGWNPVSIKKIIITREGHDTVVLSKMDGIWKTDKQFDGMGVAPQIINYFSTMQIKATSLDSSTALTDVIRLETFDKHGQAINTIALFPENKMGECTAKIDDKMPPVLISNTHNNISIRKLVEELQADK